MTKYTVTGGTPLRGKVHLHGAKNAGFKEIIAALLADSPSTICGLGLISEIDFARQVIGSLGGKVQPEEDPHCQMVDPAGLKIWEISPELSLKSRFSPMYVGPLLHRFGRAVLPIPGGDVTIGRRPINRQLDGLRALGATVDFHDGAYYFETKNGLKGTRFRFEKNTHNGTEILIMAAVKALGRTIIENAAEEPEVDDLIAFLNAMGGKIKRTAKRVIEIEGVSKLRGVKHTVMLDRNEAVTFGCAALATKGDITVIGADPKVLTAFLEALTKVGAGVEIKKEGIRFFWKQPLKATYVVAVPYPGFMTDWQPLWATLMTQAVGESVVHEAVYERRFDYVPGLIRMGARIELFQPKVSDPDKFYNFNIEDDSPKNKHAIRIFGPAPLSGEEVEVNDIRSGATALLAGVAAKGKTIITDHKDQIKRGYESLPEQLEALGAKITTAAGPVLSAKKPVGLPIQLQNKEPQG